MLVRSASSCHHPLRLPTITTDHHRHHHRQLPTTNYRLPQPLPSIHSPVCVSVCPSLLAGVQLALSHCLCRGAVASPRVRLSPIANSFQPASQPANNDNDNNNSSNSNNNNNTSPNRAVSFDRAQLASLQLTSRPSSPDYPVLSCPYRHLAFRPGSIVCACGVTSSCCCCWCWVFVLCCCCIVN